ncbi:MAG: hypothetical protein WCD47_00045 [Candidatus Sulfotelmatobacter sp.]
MEGISNQEGVVNTFATSVKPDVPGETYARKYLEALKKAKSDLQTEAARSGSATDYEGEIVYWSVHAAIVRDGAGKTPTPIDLTSLYQEFKAKYFNDSVPELSQSFSCTFGKLPFDSSGICYLEEDASRLGIGPGIRINEKLQEFPAEAKVALLHEMIHATGVRKHKHDFVVAIIELFEKKAYIDPLIL